MMSEVKNPSLSRRLTAEDVDVVLESSNKVLQKSMQINASMENLAGIFLQGAMLGWSITRSVFAVAGITGDFWRSKAVDCVTQTQKISVVNNSEINTTQNLSLSSPTEQSSSLQAELKIPSFETLKKGIKEALIMAREERCLDGIKDGKKIHLNEIARSGRNQILKSSGLFNSDDFYIEYGTTAGLAQEKIESFIKEIAPHINAQEAAKIALLESGRAVRSSVCIEQAAEAVLKNIQQQTLGFHFIIRENREVAYTPFGTVSFLEGKIPQHTQSFDQLYYENSFEDRSFKPIIVSQQPSGLNVSNFNNNQDIRFPAGKGDISSTKIEEVIDPSKNFDLMDAAILLGQTGLHIIESKNDIAQGNVVGAIFHAAEVSKNLVILGEQIIQNAPEGAPLDFISPQGFDCDVTIFPHTR